MKKITKKHKIPEHTYTTTEYICETCGKTSTEKYVITNCETEHKKKECNHLNLRYDIYLEDNESFNYLGPQKAPIYIIECRCKDCLNVFPDKSLSREEEKELQEFLKKLYQRNFS